MKRGFLNTSKAKKAIDEAYVPKSPSTTSTDSAPEQKKPARRPDHDHGEKTTALNDDVGNGELVDDPMDVDEAPQLIDLASSSSADLKGKGKEKEHPDAPDEPSMEETPVLEFPVRPPPARPGWGFHPLEQELHRVPPGYGLKKRSVFCSWPRDPKGKPITTKSLGKLTPDGYPWGATLYDFFFVNRFPDMLGVVSLMTSSQTLHAMKALGELTETDAVRWAESEPEPRIENFPMGGVLVEDRELMIKRGLFNQFSARHDVKSADEKMNEKQDSTGSEIKLKLTDVLSLLDIAVTSPFHPSHYPPPWPMIPFEGNLPNSLGDRIPFYLLPQTLHVHDPFNLLPAVERSASGSWTSRPDVIRSYKLDLMDPAIQRAAREKAEALEEFKARTLILMRYARTQEEKDNFEPVIEVALPPYVKRPTKIEEGHLYLSPAAKVGTGHHSVVYNAEWELPRELFVRPKICANCFKEALETEKKRLKDTGRWDRMLQAIGWGPKGFFNTTPRQEDLDAVNDPPTYAEGEIIEREVTCVVPPYATPMEVLERLDDNACWDIFLGEKGGNAFLLQFTEDEVYPDTSQEDRPPPVIRVNTKSSYFDSSRADTVCSHNRVAPVPRTAKFTVVAKLSIQYDEHLDAEAKNYQLFPDHFFQHWSGYTAMSQLHTLVPVRAIVPQFYGFYTPMPGQNGREPYLSPILLVEHCGRPIDPDELSISDKEECASLILRFQRSGWLHESVFPRNILVQKGSPTWYPLKRLASEEVLSFRLIDFGRSRKFTSVREKQQEELEVLKMFNDVELACSMGITLGSQ